MPRVNQPRTDIHKQHPLFSVLHAELGRRHVLGRFTDCICRADWDVQFNDEVCGCVSAGNGNGFLDSPLEDQRGEGAEQVDVSDTVGLEVVEEGLFEF